MEKGMGTGRWDSYWASDEDLGWWEVPAPEVLALIGGLSSATHPRVLDLGCGLGRHAVAFAQAGFCVTATDGSERAVGHLRDWAARLGLSIPSHICDVLKQPFPAGSFDVVVSYNVIYHGTWERMAEVIGHVSDLLRSGGVFFFTCPTREDGKYGQGDLVAPHTYAAMNSITPGDIHYFADQEALDALLLPFRVRSARRNEGYWLNRGERQFFSNWQIVAEKR